MLLGGETTKRIRMKAMWRGVIVLAIGLLMLGENGQAALLPRELQRQEVIFLLDSSQSMLESDPLRLIPETALEMCAILPGRYSVGLYSYNDGAVQLQPLAGLSRLPVNPLQGIAYSGFTNTGAAMKQAADAFHTGEDTACSIVIVTDGEIMLPTNEETLISVKAFQEAMSVCREKGIKVYMLALGGKQATPQANIYASDITYAVAPDAASVPAMGAKLLGENWKIGRILRTADSSGKVDLSLPVPAAALRHLRIVLHKQPEDTADGGVLSGQDAGHEIYDGQALKIFDVKNPSANLSLSGLKSGKQAELFPQLTARLETEVSQNEESQKVILRITPYTVEGDRQSLVADDSFTGKDIPVWIDDDYYTGTVQDGSILVELPDNFQGASVILPAFSHWGWNVDCEPAAAEAYGAEKKQQVPAYGWVLAIGGGSILLLAGLFAALRMKTYKQQKRRNPIPQPRASWKERYVGELTIRDIRTRSGVDHRVRVLNLYRYVEHTAMPLRKIFRECELPDTLPELDGLGLHPGKKGIWLDNDSKATVLKDGELILKGNSCFMGFDEPVQLAFGDGQLSMTMVLKDLKPHS